MDDEFTVSLWVRPDTLPNWVPHVQIGSSTDTFFLLQSSTQTAGNTGFAATFKEPGNPTQERLVLGPGNDVPLNEWTHVVFTMRGTTGKIYFDGELQGTRTDFTIDIGDVGVSGTTTANMIGGTSWPDGRFDGLVDDFRMYGHELTAEQVQELFEGPPSETAPIAVDDAYSTEEGEVLTVAAPGVLANDTDADGDALTATDVTQPLNGAVTLAEDGSFVYTPDAGFSGRDVFTYTADDGTAASAPASVTITVTRVSTPVATEISASAEDVAYGETATVSATITPPPAAGDVEVLRGTTVLASGAVSAGEATVELPAKSLLPGSHLLRVRYTGSSSHAASSTYIFVTVDKATPTMTVNAPASVPRRVPVELDVTLSAANDVPVTGQVRVSVQGGVTLTGTVVDGKVAFTLPGSDKVGTMRVQVTYLGSDLVTTAAKEITIEVRKK
jgi:hypothetical protein